MSGKTTTTTIMSKAGASLLPTYYQNATTKNHNQQKKEHYLLLKQQEEEQRIIVIFDDATWKTKKYKILLATLAIFLGSLWFVSHFSGAGFDIHSLKQYQDNAAAMAAASVMGDGVEEGIHGLEVQSHGFSETELEQEIDDIIHENPVVIFSKTYCPYSRRAKHILAQYGIDPHPYIVEVNTRNDSEDVKLALFKFTYQATFPNIFVDGRSVGGSEELAILHTTGKLKELLIDAGVLDEE
ncbi:5622_t:CDS:2 [Ambispora leptoticha]|uniref:5622_t:CDS:1 n=1 Tax=Ambispora leptoticha TaxID=144679 RepID=A0A9N8WAC5_9GLOM|nr:5622_t:CDS:2 [Ambispora leptoticha]